MKIIATALLGVGLIGMIWLDIISRPHHRRDPCDRGSVEGMFTSCGQKR